MSSHNKNTSTGNVFRFLRKFNITSRIGAGLALLALVSIATGAVGLWSIKSIHTTLNQITQVSGPTVETADDLLSTVWRANKLAEREAAAATIDALDEYSSQMSQLMQRFSERYAELERLTQGSNLANELLRVAAARDSLSEVFAGIRDTRRAIIEDGLSAASLLAQFEEVGGQLVVTLDEFAVKNEKEMAVAEDRGDFMITIGADAAAVNDVLGVLFEQDYPVVEAALKLQRLVTQLQGVAAAYVNADQAGSLTDIAARFDALIGETNSHLSVVADLATNDEEKADAAVLEDLFASWTALAVGDAQLFDTQQRLVGALTELDTLRDRLFVEVNETARVLTIVTDRADAISEGAEAAADLAVGDAELAIFAAIAAALTLSLLSGAAVVLTVTRPIAEMTEAMRGIAEGDLTRDVPSMGQTDEIGAMASAVQIFKQNGLKVRDLAEEKEQADAAAAAARRDMMQELQTSFGDVVDKAVAGDFTGRVDAAFADEELNELARGVNRLVETVNDGVSATGVVLARIAEGDLNERMTGAFQGAFADLQTNLNQTTERLAALVSEISTTTASVRRGSDRITEGADQLSGRAEQQASSLEETAATMEEMSASIKANADSSASADKLAADASERAGAGGDIVKSAVSAMHEIEASATKIADIISVIDGIAFQTNLLALNAAVEAARAGDAGKGFAVVASEVRALAQRSSEASQDIRQLIETSAAQVSQGVDLVTKTGASLEGIVASIGQVESAIKDIAAASVEQASGVEEITASVSHMDQMTQENSSLAEESASSARTLSSGARKLQELINFFKIDAAADAEVEEDADWRNVAETRPRPSPSSDLSHF